MPYFTHGLLKSRKIKLWEIDVKAYLGFVILRTDYIEIIHDSKGFL